jgi:FkbM family methyltransferase
MTAPANPAKMPARRKKEREMTGDGRTIVAVCHGIEVPEAPHIGPRMIRAMNEGRFERSEIGAALAVIRPGARVLELGAGSGLVGAIIAHRCGAGKVLSVEANPHLIAHIRALHDHNGLTDRIEVRHGVVDAGPEAPASVEFFLAGNFLGSGLTAARPEKARPVRVPVLRYAEVKAGFPHDTIMMDIEGGEREFLAAADLSGVDTVILEVHRGIYGRDGMRDIRRSFAREGLVMDVARSRPGVHVYLRPGAPAEDLPQVQ